MKEDLCIAILAGGKSKRFGSDKAMLMFNGLPLIDKTFIELKPLSGHLLLATGDWQKNSATFRKSQ